MDLRRIAVLLVIAGLLFAPGVSAIQLEKIYIAIDEHGDARVFVTYHGGAADFLALKAIKSVSKIHAIAQGKEKRNAEGPNDRKGTSGEKRNEAPGKDKDDPKGDNGKSYGKDSSKDKDHSEKGALSSASRGNGNGGRAGQAGAGNDSTAGIRGVDDGKDKGAPANPSNSDTSDKGRADKNSAGSKRAPAPGSLPGDNASGSDNGSGQDGDICLVCTDATMAELTVPGFASVQGSTYVTKEIDLPQVLSQASAVGSPVPGAAPVDVTLVFPDGYSIRQPGTSMITSAVHTVVPGQTYTAMEPPARSCEKNLPLSGVIPDEAAPVAAAGAGIVATGIGVTSLGTTVAAWFAKIGIFLQNSFGQVVQGRLADREKEKRARPATPASTRGSGFSRIEMIIIGIGALVIGILFYYATRLPIDPVTIAIYVVMGGAALIAHELAHRCMNYRFGSRTEVQFWGLGTGIMVVTSWLFGNVFAQPTLTMASSDTPVSKRDLGLVMLAGPILSIVIAILCLFLIQFGGIFATAGAIGFSINLLAAVFEMLPINPCDGRDVYTWNRGIWALVFLPLIAVYFVVNL
jgi:Zn-dependent protease